MATTPSAALVPATPVFANTGRLALAGYLAGYSGLTRQACELDLRQYASWCQQQHLRLFGARRADIECFARDREARRRARATVTRRLCTIAGFCRYAVEEELLDHSPAAHVRRPRLDYESHATALDRNELGALLAAAGLGPPAEHALISLLARNGLRVSEATGASGTAADGPVGSNPGLSRPGRPAPGRPAAPAAGLTTGAATRMLDRLGQGGFVDRTRAADPRDVPSNSRHQRLPGMVQ
jgi:hypothetical protein